MMVQSSKFSDAFKQVVFSGVVSLTILIPAVAHSVEFKQVIGIAQGDSLNLRLGPGRNFADVGDIQNGAILKILGYDDSGRWARLRRSGKNVWVSSKYLDDVNENPDLTPQTHPERFGAHLVTGIPNDDPDGGLKLRRNAALSADVKAILPLGTPVDVMRYSTNGKWAFVRTAQGRGWVGMRHLIKALPQNGGNGGNNQNGSQPTELGTDPQGGALPAIYRVTGVAQGDKLWIRNKPYANSAPLSNRGPNKRLMVIGWMSNGWAKVSVGQNIGYVNGKFLRRNRNQQNQNSNSGASTNGFPQGLTCAGTEPFWTLDFYLDQSITYKKADDANNPQVIALQATFPSPQTGSYPYTFRAGRSFGVIDQKICSDGMSSIQYGWSLKFMQSHPNGTNSTVYGCCRLQ